MSAEGTPTARGARGAVGTLPWLYTTDGILRPRDYVQLLGQGVLFLIHGAPASIRRTFGQDSKHPRETGNVHLPSSPACREAERLCEQVPAVVDHSFRTYLWATLLGLRDRIEYDAEALYVASLVHDIAFAEPPLTTDGRPCCLTVPAAHAAIEIGTNAGWSERRCQTTAEAIALHANLYVGRRRGPEAYLLYAGARLDQTGFRCGDLHPHDAEAVLANHPRKGWKRSCSQMMSLQAQSVPKSRAGFYTRRLAGNRFIVRAPFQE
jgi:hypothetical protein